MSSIAALIFLIALFALVAKRIIAYRRLTSRLRNIPVVGYSGPVSSYYSAFRYIKHARDIVQEGYHAHRHQIFRVPLLNKWQILVGGPKLIDELQRAPKDRLSGAAAVIEV
ncbi:hypothetical protein C8J56DRAFT_785980 [Mycena floridula]|nr:hypothetical protein C8J56DRAFT_785980 [Mycena floridula]